MPLPDSQRVIYSKNPLEEVICQLRFPPILRIDAEVPAAFQEAVRSEYPLYEEKAAPDPRSALPGELAKLIPSELSLGAGKRQCAFASADERWVVMLGRDAISLTSRRYKRWEEFKQRLAGPLEALTRHYSPAFYSRVGLRYRDVIRRSQLGLAGVLWTDLLQHYITAELSSPDVGTDIYLAARQLGIRFEKGRGQVVVRHGLARTNEDAGECFVIDSDYYQAERTETTDASELLDYFNRQAGRLFRWCIKERLHNAMEPRTV